MVKDDQEQVRHLLPMQPASAGGRFPVPRPLPRTLATATLVLGLTATAGFWMVRWLGASEEAPAPEKPATAPTPPAVQLFRDWPAEKPAFALVLSGQEHGYLQPCGCSKPQLGGLPRRYNFIQQLKKRDWPIVAVDLGDIFDVPNRRPPHAQALLKYHKSMEALQRMGYSAVAVGKFELEMPLMETLAEFAIQPQNTSPRLLAANLTNRKDDFFDYVAPWQISGGTNGVPKVAIVGTVGQSVKEGLLGVKNQTPPVLLGENPKVLQAALEELQTEKPDVLVLLYQGSLDEAKACAVKFPQFRVILCLTKEEEPSDKPERVGDTFIVGVGHKGRYVGVVGFFATANPKRPFALRYQLVALGEEYETPKDQEKSNPLMVLMEEYAQQVQSGNYLALYQQRAHPLQVDHPNATYVGSRECKGCHGKAYEVWAESKHSNAYVTLQDAVRPSLRQYDGECVACHVVGFGYTSGFKDDKANMVLTGVGCESCHGPGSAHIDDIRNKTKKNVHLLMNPYKPKPNATPAEEARRINALDQSCQKCHDTDNDVHWNFAKKWPEIVHHETRKKLAAPAKP